ncbi:MAG: hypothetical protein ACR2IK_03935 [Chloroflexota bacterium]
MSAIALVLRWQWAPLASIVTGLAICIFEVVEMLATTLHVWLQLLGLEVGAVSPSLPADPNAGMSLALWLQPFYFVLGLLLVGLGVRLRLVPRLRIRVVNVPSARILKSSALAHPRCIKASRE